MGLISFLRRGLFRAITGLARLMPLSSPAGCMAASLLVVGGMGCVMPPLLKALGTTAALSHFPHAAAVVRAFFVTVAAAAMASLVLFQARCLQLCYPLRFTMTLSGSSLGTGQRVHKPVATVAGLPLSQDDLCTSVLVTGVTGSSKTAGILLPLLAELFQSYNGQAREKLGAFIPEVKGDLVDAAIYLARRAGRDVAKDVIILTPACRIPVLRYRDESGRRWFLSGRGGAGGSDAGDLLPAECGCGPDRLEEPDRCADALRTWAQFPVDVARLRPRYIGWRWRGGRLFPARGGSELAAPRILIPEAVEYVDNGAHFNLIDARLPAGEVAERLTRLAAMARGAGTHGENDYFYEQGRKLLASCLTLLRATSSEAPTLADVVRCATQDEFLEPRLAELATAIARGDARHCDLAAYFRGEWLRMVADGKTATIVRSTLSAAFDLFLHDPALAETFCRPSTLAFSDIAQKGKIIAFVPGDRYEQVGRVLGTACKMEFQTAMLARTGRPGMNTSRLALYLADECHKYAVAGSATAGDPYFMNLSRSNRVVNICATQSYAWLVDVLGRDPANVYLAAFGVQYWLQQTDPETCQRAAEICGSVMREKVTAESDVTVAGVVAALGGGHPVTLRQRRMEEEVRRFRPEDFGLLDVGEVVAYNKGLPGRAGKVRRGQVEYLPCTRPPKGPAAVAASVRDYYRDLLENLAAERGLAEAWNCTAAAEGSAEFAAYVGQSDQNAAA